MKIAIISDVHNNLANLKKVLDYCKNKKVSKIICCGDLASLETLDFLCDNFKPFGIRAFKCNIHFVFGNMDEDHFKTSIFQQSNGSLNNQVEHKNAIIFEKFGEAEFDNKKTAFVHFPNKAKKLCETGKYNFVFYGHTHEPWEQDINNCKMLNPGTVGGERCLPSFAIWDTKNNKFELIRVNELK